ncbi:hypothetical protein BJ741DRAFT_668299 [Chytriomyces cf. hyalinus JEL632]|nr:hypothetical protein BJ741DRAFT_668299 [Chytriomyces cf. hyalinus JEL632]
MHAHRQSESFDEEEDYDECCSDSEYEDNYEEDFHRWSKPLIQLDGGGYWPLGNRHDDEPVPVRAISLLRILSHAINMPRILPDGRESFCDDFDMVLDLVDRRLSFIPQVVRTRTTFNEELIPIVVSNGFFSNLETKFVDVVMSSEDSYFHALIELKYANERYIKENKALDTMSDDELFDVRYTFDGTNISTMRMKEAEDAGKLVRIMRDKPGYIGVTVCGVGGHLLRRTRTGSWARGVNVLEIRSYLQVFTI